MGRISLFWYNNNFRCTICMVYDVVVLLIPKCPICRKPMVNAVDSITKKVSPYLWQTTCGHCPDLRLSIG